MTGWTNFSTHGQRIIQVLHGAKELFWIYILSRVLKQLLVQKARQAAVSL
jgi:hypothetical protein